VTERGVEGGKKRQNGDIEIHVRVTFKGEYVDFANFDTKIGCDPNVP